MNSTNIPQDQAASILARVFNICPTLTQYQIMQYATIIKFDDNELIAKPGQKLEGIYIIISGGLQLYERKNNKKHIFHFIAPQEILGLPNMISHLPFPFYALTMGKTEVAFLPQSVIDKMIDDHSHSFLNLIKIMNEKVNNMERRSTSLMTDNAELTVYKALEDLKLRFGTNQEGYINIHIPAKELAGYLGMSKTSFYRVLNTMKDKNILFHYLDLYKLEKNLVS